MSGQRGLFFALIALSLGLSWYFTRNPEGPGPRAECLTHRDCQSQERCVVIPKNDGFASFGQCGEPCQTDAECPNGWECREWAEAEGMLVPPRGADGARVKICAHHLTQ